MSARATAARAVTAALGLPPVTGWARRRWADRLRVIDYHGIEDAEVFERQMRFLASRYQVVDEDRVRRALHGDGSLPERAVWVTFDDGDPTVVARGLEVLVRVGVPATFYVCPGLVEAGEPPWWELVLAAGRAGHGAEVNGRELAGPALVRELKLVPDRERRDVVDKLRDVGLDRMGPDEWVLHRADLDRWVDAGLGLGNHTWDHPCLHRCDAAEQAAQIRRGQEWLLDYRPGRVPSFAYPNGDRTDHAESVLEDLGCDLALLSDHRLVDPTASPLRVSRLRLDASAPLNRARAVVSGVHSAGYQLALDRGLTGPPWAGR